MNANIDYCHNVLYDFHTIEDGASTTVLLFNCGEIIFKYNYWSIEKPFQSPFLNNFNLHFMGDWYWDEIDDECLMYRVSSGVKPAGSVIMSSKEELEPLVEGIKSRKYKIKIDTLQTRKGQFFRLSAFRKEHVKKLFDLKALRDAYWDLFEAHEIFRYEKEADMANMLTNVVDLLSNSTVESVFTTIESGCDFSSWETAIPQALVLGYPIEYVVARVDEPD